MEERFGTRVVHTAARSVEDLITDKRVWAAALGFVGVISRWQGWDIPSDVFIAGEALIVALIFAWKGE